MTMEVSYINPIFEECSKYGDYNSIKKLKIYSKKIECISQEAFDGLNNLECLVIVQLYDYINV